MKEKVYFTVSLKVQFMDDSIDWIDIKILCDCHAKAVAMAERHVLTGDSGFKIKGILSSKYQNGYILTTDN